MTENALLRSKSARLTRRMLLREAATLGLGMLLAACSNTGPTPTPGQNTAERGTTPSAPRIPSPATQATGQTSVSVALDWYPWSNHTGLLMAQEHGAFAQQGLDVRLEVPANPDDVLKLVATGRNTFGISYETDVLEARAQGLPVVSIAALVQHPLNSVMALKRSGITRPRDLVGKQVGYPGIPSDEALLATMLESDGAKLDQVQLVNVGYDLVAALLGHKVDAVIGAYWVHESILIEQQGEQVTVLKVEDWGVPDFYELVLVTSDDQVKQHANLVQRFVRAMIRGYQDAQANLQAAVDLLVKRYPDTNRSVEEVGIQRLAPLWTAGVPIFGWQEASRWQQYAAWMKTRGLLSGQVDPNSAFTNQFVETARTSA